MNKLNIVNNSLSNLFRNIGLKGEWFPMETEIDGEINLLVNNKKMHLDVVVKNELRNHQIPLILEMAKKHKSLMIVAERIFPSLKETLRENKIGYLDTAGNIFINVSGQLLWIDGHKNAETERPVTNRAFTKTGLKTVFYLMQHTNNINLPYRSLSVATNVALGNIKNIFTGLKEAGFILPVNGKEVKLQNKKDLLNRWIAGYRETLKPSLHLGNFKFWKDDAIINWKTLPVIPGKTMWGAEPAAEIITNYINPEILTIYTGENKAVLIPKWKLIPAENGNIQLYEKFWNDSGADQHAYTPLLLVYADLMITDDPRCIETAGIIYNKYLKHEFERY